MWFQLAELLHIPVRELMGRMDSREFSEWYAYFAAKEKQESGKISEPEDILNAFLSMPGAVDNREEK